MKKSLTLALIGFSLTVLFIAIFIALIFTNSNIVRIFLGIGFLLGCVKFYLGSKGIKRFSYSLHNGLKVEYYKSR